MAPRILSRAVKVPGVVYVSNMPVAPPPPKSDPSQCNVLRRVCLQLMCCRTYLDEASAASLMSFTFMSLESRVGGGRALEQSQETVCLGILTPHVLDEAVRA